MHIYDALHWNPHYKKWKKSKKTKIENRIWEILYIGKGSRLYYMKLQENILLSIV